MQKINDSSLWVERYRPKTLVDLICPPKTRALLEEIKKSGEMQNLILFGTAGIGKTSAAYAICNDLGAEVRYINASLETSIDVIRDDVSQFASTNSVVSFGQKVVILDESDRLSPNAQDALKVILEQTESNCRFIFCTNNLQKIISPLHSRCKLLSFNYGAEDSKEIMLQYFKRICFVLQREGYTVGQEEKSILAEFVKNYFPDFRKMLNELQGYVKANKKIDLALLRSGDNTMVVDLIGILKTREFNKMRKLCVEIDSDSFYRTFYDEIEGHVRSEAIPDIVMTLAKYGASHCACIDKEINLTACCTELMSDLNGKWK